LKILHAFRRKLILGTVSAYSVPKIIKIGLGKLKLFTTIKVVTFFGDTVYNNTLID